MNSKDINKEIFKLAERLQTEIINQCKERRSVAVAHELGLKYSDVSAWINGKRYWSLEKIISVAGKLGL
jgi:hypothetical protein